MTVYTATRLMLALFAGVGFMCVMVALGKLMDAYDNHRQQRLRRIKRKSVDQSYQSGQFQVPKQMRDFK